MSRAMAGDGGPRLIQGGSWPSPAVLRTPANSLEGSSLDAGLSKARYKKGSGFCMVFFFLFFCMRPACHTPVRSICVRERLNRRLSLGRVIDSHASHGSQVCHGPKTSDTFLADDAPLPGVFLMAMELNVFLNLDKPEVTIECTFLFFQDPSYN